MDTIMELDELKQAWQQLDRRLARSDALQLAAYRERRFASARRRLLSLRLGQALQILFGVLVVLLSVASWRANLGQPLLFASGILMHAYGVLCILVGGLVQQRISDIDYSAPVLAIQKQLAAVRRTHSLGGLWVGLPWLFLWVPALAMFVRWMTGFDLYVAAPLFAWSSLGAGVLLLVAALWLFRWSRSPARPRLAAWVERSLAADSLQAAQEVLDDVRRFESE
ncbi:MAG: serine/threonine protein kinase [Lysobacteraceae bacterium]